VFFVVWLLYKGLAPYQAIQTVSLHRLLCLCSQNCTLLLFSCPDLRTKCDLKISKNHLSTFDSRTHLLPMLINRLAHKVVSTCYFSLFLNVRLCRIIVGLDLGLVCKFLPLYFTRKYTLSIYSDFYFIRLSSTSDICDYTE